MAGPDVAAVNRLADAMLDVAYNWDDPLKLEVAMIFGLPGDRGQALWSTYKDDADRLFDTLLVATIRQAEAMGGRPPLTRIIDRIVQAEAEARPKPNRAARRMRRRLGG